MIIRDRKTTQLLIVLYTSVNVKNAKIDFTILPEQHCLASITHYFLQDVFYSSKIDTDLVLKSLLSKVSTTN